MLAVKAGDLREFVEDLPLVGPVRGANTALRWPESVLVWFPNSVASWLCGLSFAKSTGNILMRQPSRLGNKTNESMRKRNIVVIADEAHRSQYDLIDGLARNLRDALLYCLS